MHILIMLLPYGFKKFNAGFEQKMLDVSSEALRPFPILRILLVEDLLINQEITRQTLVAVGHHVEVASDGAAAIEAVQNRQYDIVLMDIQMPGVDGLAATRAIVTAQVVGKPA